ncbi:MAG TPA: hemerythrin domain-containing protein [Verrucomicrobiae bacterium]|nr:hemerythrin domain-containing protein [Verrucomicrobiae bacterium]
MPSPNDRAIQDFAAVPAAGTAFDGCQIEACCSGEKPPTQACLAALNSVQVAEALDPAKMQPEDRHWQTVSLAQLCEHILEAHHSYVRRAIQQLNPQIEELARVGGRSHAELPVLRNVFQRLAEELGSHLMKEERILFPYIEQLEHAASSGKQATAPMFGTVRNPIRMMVSEHDGAEGLLLEMRNITRDYRVPVNAGAKWESIYRALREFEADLSQHIHLENDILFPRAIELEAAQSARE